MKTQATSLRLVLALAGLLLPGTVDACSPPAYGFYDGSTVSIAVAAADVPKPILSNLELVRGKISAGSSCDDAGQINFSVSIPKGSDLNVSDFGLRMRLVDGTDPYSIVSAELIRLWSEDPETADVSLWWLDGAPDEQWPLDLAFELRLVLGKNLGPATKIRIRSPKNR